MIYDFSCFFFFYFTLPSMAKPKTYYIEYKATYSGWALVRANSKKQAIEIAKNSNTDELLKDQDYKPDSIEFTLVEEDKTKH